MQELQIDKRKLVKDISGFRFGRLTALYFSYRKNKRTYWVCKCDCGNETVSCIDELKSGDTKSCGCLKTETQSKHGLSRHPLYQTYIAMINRCHNSNNYSYKNYGERGIAVCDEWKNNIESFIKWAEKTGYTKDKTIDRRDTNGNYEPSNCRWATKEQQGRNKRNNVLITIGSDTKTLIEWCEVNGMTYNTIQKRIQSGWSPIRALTQKIRNKKKHEII